MSLSKANWIWAIILVAGISLGTHGVWKEIIDRIPPAPPAPPIGEKIDTPQNGVAVAPEQPAKNGGLTKEEPEVTGETPVEPGPSWIPAITGMSLATTIVLLLVWLASRATPAGTGATAPWMEKLHYWIGLVAGVGGLLTVNLAVLAWGGDIWTFVSEMTLLDVIVAIGATGVVVASAIGGYHYAMEPGNSVTKTAFVLVMGGAVIAALMSLVLSKELVGELFSTGQTTAQESVKEALRKKDVAEDDVGEAAAKLLATGKEVNGVEKEDGGKMVDMITSMPTLEKTITWLYNERPAWAQWVLVVAVLALLAIGKPETKDRTWGGVWAVAGSYLAFSALTSNLVPYFWDFDWSKFPLGAWLGDDKIVVSYLTRTFLVLMGLVVFWKGIWGLGTFMSGPKSVVVGGGAGSAPARTTTRGGNGLLDLMILLMAVIAFVGGFLYVVNQSKGFDWSGVSSAVTSAFAGSSKLEGCDNKKNGLIIMIAPGATRDLVICQDGGEEFFINSNGFEILVWDFSPKFRDEKGDLILQNKLEIKDFFSLIRTNVVAGGHTARVVKRNPNTKLQQSAWERMGWNRIKIRISSFR